MRIEALEMVSINAIWIIPAIALVVQGIKLVTKGRVNDYAFLISVVLGMIVSYFFNNDLTVKFWLVQGVISGLASSGLYSGIKSTNETVKRMKHERKIHKKHGTNK